MTIYSQLIVQLSFDVQSKLQILEISSLFLSVLHPHKALNNFGSASRILLSKPCARSTVLKLNITYSFPLKSQGIFIYKLFVIDALIMDIIAGI